MHKSEKHQFALYVQNLEALTAKVLPGQFVTLTDSDLVHRIIAILRLQVDEAIILFSNTVHCSVIITQLVKNKFVQVALQEKNKNNCWKPEITFLLPLLKKESLETALYALTEIGATHIQLVITHKSQQKWLPKEHERAQKIIIAAAEQSKNFAFPQLIQPLTLQESLLKSNAMQHKLFFDPEGKSLSIILKDYEQAKPTHIVLMVGPEGDLTASEKELLISSGFTFAALTPTILRACQAVSVSAGIIRSLCK